MLLPRNKNRERFEPMSLTNFIYPYVKSPEGLQRHAAFKRHAFGLKHEGVITREQLERGYAFGYESDDKLITCGKLGAGNDGFVVKVRDKTGQDPDRACKFIKSIGSEEDIANEIEAIKRALNLHLRPPAASHIFPIHDHFFLADWYCVVMPLAEANLWALLKDFREFITTSALKIPYWRDVFFTWISCLSHTLLAAHNRSIGHGDIKLTNTLVFRRSVFLADFGLTRSLYQKPGTYINRIAQRDVFSLGGIIWEILRTISKPFLRDEIPAVDPQDYAATPTTSISRLDWAIERVSLLENPEQFKSLIESLMTIVLSDMMTQPAERKELGNVCDKIDTAMAELEFQPSYPCHRYNDAKARDKQAKASQKFVDVLGPPLKEWLGKHGLAQRRKKE
jgi:serine/threonine protein kinase